MGTLPSVAALERSTATAGGVPAAVSDARLIGF
jgi:hypothetical protein